MSHMITNVLVLLFPCLSIMLAMAMAERYKLNQANAKLTSDNKRLTVENSGLSLVIQQMDKDTREYRRIAREARVDTIRIATNVRREEAEARELRDRIIRDVEKGNT